MLKRKTIIIFLNIFLPLFIGLLIYLFFRKNTYINLFFENVFFISLPYLYSDSVFCRVLTSWACDILWAYSLTFSLFFCFKSFINSLQITYILSVLFSIAFELLQLTSIIIGTFDVWDIILEIAAISLAVIIIKKEFSK